MAVIPAKEIPTAHDLYRLRVLREPVVHNKRVAQFDGVKSLNKRVGLIRADITQLQVDGIVNAAKKSLEGGGGVDGAIHRAAGKGLLEACKKLGGCEIGEAKATDGFSLPCKTVIHTVGPDCRGRKPTELDDDRLSNCYRSSLKLAARHKLSTLAIPCISTGIYGFPADRAAKRALYAARKSLEKNDDLDLIVFVLNSEEDMLLYRFLLP